MILTPGTRLGPYDIVALIGAGGMGEVFRARDTKLNRDVAIKVLPAAFADDPDPSTGSGSSRAQPRDERLARFMREAQTLASLNHPGIATIYGIEEITGADGSAGAGSRALVMELVEGDDLSAHIARGPMPVAEALPIARQIAEALEAAHEQGIIHRDLKPANVKVRADGTVKVLDFGLAKAMFPGAEAPGLQADGGPGLQARANSPTMTSPAMTAMGMILGTAAYMAPEQAKGKAVDRRADIWAFGVVLYEMLTGRRAFDPSRASGSPRATPRGEGDNVVEMLAAVLHQNIDFDALPESTPPRLRRLLERCLERDAKLRLRDIGEARIALAQGDDPAPTPVRQRRRLLAWAPAVIALVSVAVAAWVLWNRPAEVRRPSARLSIALPPDAEITSYPAISRDGRTVAYVARQGTGDAQLYLRDLDSFEARLVAGSGSARQPFFSPDGKWVGFFAQGQLQKAEVAGGAPIRLVEAPYAFGGTWTEDNTIVYSSELGSGLLRIAASGGTAEPLTRPDAAAKGYAHVFPQALPGGRSVLFTVWGQTQGSAVLSLDSGNWQLVSPSPAKSFAVAIFDAATAIGSPGRLLIVDQTAGIRFAPFDPAHPARTSAEGSLLQGVYYDVDAESQGWLAVSNAGAAVYAAGNPARSSLVWVDREGRAESLGGDQAVYRETSLSPDGSKAIVRHGPDLWIHDLRRGTRSPLTTSGIGSNIRPLWSRDGLQVIFASNRGGDWDIYSQPADGSRPAELLLRREGDQFPNSMLGDGTLLYVEIRPTSGRDLWTMTPDGKTTPFRVTPFNELAAKFSPGVPRWVAYASDESGRFEIYVQSYPGGARRVPVSTDGGILPMWSPDGQELVYVTGDAVVAVPIRPDGSIGAARRLFDRSTYLFNDRFHSYSVSPDGKRFLMIRRDPDSVPRQLNVILDWPDTVARAGAGPSNAREAGR